MGESDARLGASGFTLRAWVDESMQAGATGVGLYLLAAAVTDPASCEPMRDRLRALVPKGKSRLHWRDEDDGLRRRIADAVAGLDLTALVVVGQGYVARRQERARRVCMERLFFELENMGTSSITLESRTPSLNAKDLAMVAGLRGRGSLKGVRVEFGLPSVEPMLWIPDAVAGAVGAARSGRDGTARDRMAAVVEEITIVVR
ncbi:hypothetical protein [Nocardia sp. NPDC057227]|uniref:hypothetical protein n=1 Tax=Nocardia sp. NPDC057227 TaxID=3346056 RepID=UPI003640C2CD